MQIICIAESSILVEYLYDWLIDFDDMSNFLHLFYY